MEKAVIVNRLMQKILPWLWDHASPYFDLEGYMERKWLFVCPWFGIRIHHILASDNDRAFHDHPYNYASYIVKGHYTEHTPQSVYVWGPGSFRIAKAESLHFLKLESGTTVWTLFFTGPRKRNWGFQTDSGWIPWNQYVTT